VEFLERAGEVGVRFWAALGRATKVSDAELTPRQREVLRTMETLGDAAIEEIRKRLQQPPSLRMVQRILATLIESGRIRRSGKGRSTRYRPAE
jgi:predicted transcriptional regulator